MHQVLRQLLLKGFTGYCLHRGYTLLARNYCTMLAFPGVLNVLLIGETWPTSKNTRGGEVSLLLFSWQKKKGNV